MRIFNGLGVRYLVVGGYALMLHTEPRYTKDLDHWVEPVPENAAKVYRALLAFGAPLAGVSEQDFATEGILYQMGRPPVRVDILMSVSGLRFSEAWLRRRESDLGGERVQLLGLDDLITNKKATGRLQDLADAERLEALRGK